MPQLRPYNWTIKIFVTLTTLVLFTTFLHLVYLPRILYLLRTRSYFTNFRVLGWTRAF